MSTTRQVFNHECFGARVRRWRKALHLTQRDVAAAIGVTGGFVAHIETGRTLPSVRTCKKIADALGVHELEVLAAAGYVTGDVNADDQLLEPELRLFFRDTWPQMSEDEQGVLKELAGVLGARIGRA